MGVIKIIIGFLLVLTSSWSHAIDTTLSTMKSSNLPIQQIEEKLNSIEKSLHNNKKPSELYLSYTKDKLESLEVQISKQLSVNKQKLQRIKNVINSALDANTLNKKPLIDFENNNEYHVSKTIQLLKKSAGKMIENILTLNLLNKQLQLILSHTENQYTKLNFGSVWRGSASLYTFKAWKNIYIESKKPLILKPKTKIEIVQNGLKEYLIGYTGILLFYLIFAPTIIKKATHALTARSKKYYPPYFLTHLLFIGIIPYYLFENFLLKIAFYCGFHSYTSLILIHDFIATIGFLLLVSSILLPAKNFFEKNYRINIKLTPLISLSLLCAAILFINNADMFDLLIHNRRVFAHQISALISVILLSIALVLLLAARKKLKRTGVPYD